MVRATNAAQNYVEVECNLMRVADIKRIGLNPGSLNPLIRQKWRAIEWAMAVKRQVA